MLSHNTSGCENSMNKIDQMTKQAGEGHNERLSKRSTATSPAETTL